MAWHSVFLNFLFAALVVGGVCGSLLWAIATQHRDWPRHARAGGTPNRLRTAPRAR